MFYRKQSKDKDLNLIMNDLYRFYMLFVARDYSEKVEAPHIRELSNCLMHLYLGDFSRLCVAMPPRHSKSSMVTLAFPLWLIFRNPNLNILIVNNTATLSEKFGIQLRELVRRYGKYNEFDVHLSNIKSSKSHLMFENGKGDLYRGSIRLTGVDGSITGQDVDYLILDDIYKGIAMEMTPSALQKRIDWFEVIIEQRLEPSSKLAILHTRWHSNDLQGYLKSKHPKDYEFLSFPAITDRNEPLWKERYSMDDLLKKKESMGDRMFSAIYQQKPLDLSSDFFDIDSIHFEKPQDFIPKAVCRGWDIASSDPSDGLKGDFTCGALLEMSKDGRYVLSDLKYGQFGNLTKDIVIDTARQDGVKTAQIIETGVAGAGKLLFNEWKSQMKGYRVRRAKAITSKQDRATPLQNCILDGKFYVNLEPSSRADFLQNFSEFPLGIHDDIVDAVAHSYNFLSRKRRNSSPMVGVINY